MDNYNSYNNMDNFEENNVSPSTQETFQAYVDGVIPRTPGLAEEYGRVQYFGALDLYTDEYIIYTLNYFDIPLAKPVAELLDLAGGTFAALSAADRFRVLSYLEQISGYLVELPEEIADNPGFVLTINSTLNRYTMIGYYSEWPGYGNTRLNSPDVRNLEFYPLSWQQIEYPGPSMGYRALRE